jgi:gliding motility-associated-like protein
MKTSIEGENLLFRKYEIAELAKINNCFTIKNPVLVLEGVSWGGLTTYAGEDDKIYFPATPIPYHYINFTNKSICNKFTHEFTNETDTNWFDHFMWFWGDGDSTASHKSQPIMRHQYPKPGKYRVNLKSITAHGGWVWYSDSVEVLPEPIAKYQTKNTVGCQWIAVKFNDSSVLQKKNHTWYWDFGDGTDTILQSSNGIMPSQKRIEHTYSSSGKFNVQLRITDGRCTDTFSTTQNIDILPAPRPGISIDKTTGCTPLEVRFARTYSDQTDSTIYHFKPALNPNNRFNGSQNTAVISKSGPYLLHQKLYGPSGCVTEDSVSLQITQGILPNTKPHLKRSTVVNNRTVLTDWNPVPHAKDYQVYRNGQPHAVSTDTQFIDYLNRDIDRTYIYEIIAKDSCGNLASAKSNIGKPIFLQVKQIEPASKSEFATALLTWTPYEDWSNSGGVENYSIFGNYAIESQSWQLLKNQTDTQLHDPDFIAPPNYEKCYRVNAKSLDGRYQTQSNVACLDFPATLFAPNSFTPNGDGLNDAFEIFNYGFDRFTMTIYNSWGQKVFDQTGPTATWHPSKDIPQGVYIYQIKAVRNEKEFNFSGTVSLLR